jgi:hypothetical protein
VLTTWDGVTCSHENSWLWLTTLGPSAAWHGARIVMRQVSEEANEIFDLIMELYNCRSNDWLRLAQDTGVGVTNVHEFVTYAATFLSNLGNYYVFNS